MSHSCLGIFHPTSTIDTKKQKCYANNMNCSVFTKKIQYVLGRISFDFGQKQRIIQKYVKWSSRYALSWTHIFMKGVSDLEYFVYTTSSSHFLLCYRFMPKLKREITRISSFTLYKGAMLLRTIILQMIQLVAPKIHFLIIYAQKMKPWTSPRMEVILFYLCILRNICFLLSQITKKFPICHANMEIRSPTFSMKHILFNILNI